MRYTIRNNNEDPGVRGRTKKLKNLSSPRDFLPLRVKKEKTLAFLAIIYARNFGARRLKTLRFLCNIRIKKLYVYDIYTI